MNNLMRGLKGKKTHLVVLALMALNYFSSDGVLTDSGVNIDLLKDNLMLALISTFRSALTTVVQVLTSSTDDYFYLR